MRRLRCHWLTAVAVVGMMVAGCGDDTADEAGITFQITSHPATGGSEWVATGAAVEDGFIYVSTAEYACGDGSGSFTLRLLADVEDPAAFTLAATWQLEGDDGYEGVIGEGQNDDISVRGEPVVATTSNSGVLRRT